MTKLLEALSAVDPTCPSDDAFCDLLRCLHRDARKAATQARAQINFEWADEPGYQKQISDTQKRLDDHARRLAEVWPGATLERDGDLRGYLIRLVPPNRRGTSFAGGVGVA